VFRTVGCENDDSCGRHLRHLLAASAHVLRRAEPPAEHHLLPPYPPRLPCHLLVRYEQLHVQPYHVLLDERQVRYTQLLAFLSVSAYYIRRSTESKSLRNLVI